MTALRVDRHTTGVRMAVTLVACCGTAVAEQPQSVFAKQNLVAWCIVPFDAKQRGPAARAEMLSRLGIQRVAYDWREKHVPTFEQEILEYQKHQLEYFAFWDWHPDMEPLIRKHSIKPQIWLTCSAPGELSQQEKVKAAAERLLPHVARTQSLGSRLGLYNHGGWGGAPANLVAVCQYLRQHHEADHVGIVYNFHHGHDHMHDFADALAKMQPYLLCLNLNGMVDDAKPKILPVGSGQHERRMIETIRRSGYRGPIGILDHRSELDAEQSLAENLQGLRQILREQGDQAALATYQ